LELLTIAEDVSGKRGDDNNKVAGCLVIWIATYFMSFQDTQSRVELS
jgi:hypothetical protein